MRKRGFTLIELMTSIVIFGVVLGGLFTAFVAMWNNQSQSIGMPGAQMSAKQMAYSLAEQFRSAVNCLSTDSSCTVGAPIQNASSTGCTIYSRNSSGTLVETTYAVNSGSYQVTTGGSTTTYATGATLALTYYSSTTYNATALTSFTPTSTTATNLIAVQIVASATLNGSTNTYTTLVRLRNSP